MSPKILFSSFAMLALLHTELLPTHAQAEQQALSNRTPRPGSVRVEVVDECRPYFSRLRQVQELDETRRCTLRLTQYICPTCAESKSKMIAPATVDIFRARQSSPSQKRKIATVVMKNTVEELDVTVRAGTPLSILSKRVRSIIETNRPGERRPRDSQCSALEARFEAERRAAQSCESDQECGQIMESTSCGCTRDWVARNDADLTGFYAVLQSGIAADCIDMIPISSCDCPSTQGFRCVSGSCGWNYIPEPDPELE